MTKVVAGAGANLLSQHAKEHNQDATAYVGNLDPQVTEDILWELFTQVARVQSVYIPRDKITTAHSGYGFVELANETAVDYAVKILNNCRLYGRCIRMSKASHKDENVGANLFVGNLSRTVDNYLLGSIFSGFGRVVYSSVVHSDDQTRPGYGFVHYDCFEASDLAIESMDKQFIENQQVSVSYARKKDSGELHGSPAEREIAAKNPDRKPHIIPKFQPPLPPPEASAATGGYYHGYGSGVPYTVMPPPPPQQHDWSHHHHHAQAAPPAPAVVAAPPPPQGQWFPSPGAPPPWMPPPPPRM